MVASDGARSRGGGGAGEGEVRAGESGFIARREKELATCSCLLATVKQLLATTNAPGNREKVIGRELSAALLPPPKITVLP